MTVDIPCTMGDAMDVANEPDSLSFSQARAFIKSKFINFHKILDNTESELLTELELLEDTNKPELDHVRSDLVRLRGVVSSLDESLGTNTLKIFLDEQKSVWKRQILGFERSVELLTHVTLNFSDIENSIRNVIKVVPFWSKAKFRTELEPVLELEPELGEDWYVVCNKWFSEFTDSINLTNPQQNDSWEFPVKIPIQKDETNYHANTNWLAREDNNTRLLHSKAWGMLLAFNGLSPGSIPIKRQSYLNETTNKIEVPKHPTKHKCTIGHIDGNNRFSFEFEIGTFPYETSEDILNKLKGFSTLFTDYPPIIYTLNNTDTISCDGNYVCYTVTNITIPAPAPAHYHVYGQPSPYPYGVPAITTYPMPTRFSIPDSKLPVSVIDKIFLVIIPDSKGKNPFQVYRQ